MIINGYELLKAAPIKDMESTKISSNGVTYGLSEAGYDIRVKQNIVFTPNGDHGQIWAAVSSLTTEGVTQFHQVHEGRFVLASAIEEFDMPVDMVAIVHDKSSWARRGLSVFNTVIENGWKGFLTLELVYYGNEELIIPAGSGIAQVVFHQTACDAQYVGRYQNQENKPVPAKEAV